MAIVIPCVDIQRGRAVRLYKGDPKQETVYFDSPLLAAQHWAGLGAKMLHIVDLDAATGAGNNRQVIREIVEVVKIPIEIGGGVRGLQIARDVLALGVARVVVGTVAVTHPELLDAMLTEFDSERIVVSIDARDNLVAVKGWVETSATKADELARQVWQQGVRSIIYTDVTRDGTLEGLSEAPLKTMRAAWAGELIVGGGVRDVRDVALLDTLGIEGAIVGRAIYEGTLKLEETI